MVQYEQECLEKIINKQFIEQDELRDIVNVFIVDKISENINKDGEPYFRSKNIVKLKERFFEIDFSYRCKDFGDKKWEQPVEVEKVKVEKVVILDEWKVKE